ncbi:MAG: tRNA (adenosine(37)-N6)-dimethylallyltransferase MiaA [Erysipelotrichaceae bacterium]|nr:tRNA (adenosine(37)-N6)-dimethylallyltransferase MiaA [Erysipelotrichaceae bacterium]
MFEIRKTTYEDLKRIEEIYAAARQKMRDIGNYSQWNNNYPSVSVVEEDIEKGNSYVVTDNDKVVATFAFIIGEDPTYKKIDGKWLNDLPYGTVHRIASDKGVKGIMPFVIDYVKRSGYDIRIDTHEKNSVMIHQILKCGFKYCGIIITDDGTPRNAYQLRKKVLVVVGPTAVGKTSFAIDMANRYDGEIISGDSIQIYKGLDIGSAKATKEEQSRARHYLIDIKEPDENYSVKEFQDLSRHYIDEITRKGKLPIICGGTGLYIKASLYDYTFFDEDEEDNQYIDLSNEEIYELLKEKDPKALEKIHVNNRKRLVRALNILEKHDKGISEIKDEQEHKPVYDCLIIGLTKERKELYQKIDERIDQMIDDGLIDEIDGLLNKGISFDNQSMQGIGYKEFRAYYDKEMPMEECIDKVKSNTHHFVKRQYTFFKNQLDVKWYEDKAAAEEFIEKWMENKEIC